MERGLEAVLRDLAAVERDDFAAVERLAAERLAAVERAVPAAFAVDDAAVLRVVVLRVRAGFRAGAGAGLSSSAATRVGASRPRCAGA